MTDASAQGGSGYPVRFASPRRDGSMAARTAARGVVAWTVPLPPGAGALATLLAWGDKVVAAAEHRLVAFGADGTVLWSREHRAASPAAIANGRLYFQTPGFYLEAVDPDNQPLLGKAPLPGISGSATFVELLWPRARDFIVAATLPDPKYDSEDGSDPPAPRLFARRVEYGSRTGQWSKTYRGTPGLPLLFLPESSRWVAQLGQVIVADVDKAQEQRFALPLEQALDWSADASGLIAVLGIDKGRRVLLAIDATGSERWRHALDGTGEDWAPGQPPIGAASGRLVVLTTQRVLAFDQGRPAWSFDVASDSLRHGAQAGDGSFEIRDGRLHSTARLRFGTALGDGSVLVVSESRLWHVDAQGRRLFSVALPGTVATPPVLDGSGAIHVGTSAGLVRIE